MDFIKEIISVAKSAITYCSICQDSIKNAVLLRCNHAFCKECFEASSNVQAKGGSKKKIIRCPNCKTVVPKNSTYGDLNSDLDNGVFQELILHLECETGIDFSHVQPSSQSSTTYPPERYIDNEENPEEIQEIGESSMIPETCLDPPLVVTKFYSRRKVKSTGNTDLNKSDVPVTRNSKKNSENLNQSIPSRLNKITRSRSVPKVVQTEPKTKIKEKTPLGTKKQTKVSPKKNTLKTAQKSVKPSTSKDNGFDLDLYLEKSRKITNTPVSSKPESSVKSPLPPDENLEGLSLTVHTSESLPTVSGLSFPSNIGPTDLQPEDGVTVIGSDQMTLTAQERRIITKYLTEDMEMEPDIVQETVFKTPKKVSVEVETSEESEDIIGQVKKSRKANIIESSSSSNSPELVDCSMERRVEDLLFADSPSSTHSLRPNSPPAKLQQKRKSFDSVWKRIKKTTQTPEKPILPIPEKEPEIPPHKILDQNLLNLINEITTKVIRGIDASENCILLRNILELPKITEKVIKYDKFTNTDTLVLQCPDCKKNRDEKSMEMVPVENLPIAPTQNLRVEPNLQADYDFLMTSSFDEELMTVCVDIDKQKRNTQAKNSQEIPIQINIEPVTKKRTQSQNFTKPPSPKRLKPNENTDKNVTIDSSDDDDCIYNTPDSKPAFSQINQSVIPGTEFTPHPRTRRQLNPPLEISVVDIEPFETAEALTLPDQALTPPPNFGDDNQCDYTKLPEMTILKEMKTPDSRVDIESLKESTILLEETPKIESCVPGTPNVKPKSRFNLNAPLEVVKDTTPKVIKTPIKQTNILSYVNTPRSTQSSQLSISKAREFFKPIDSSQTRPIAHSTPNSKIFNRNKKINLMFTQLRASEIDLLDKFCKIFNVDFTAANSENTTHLVAQTDENNRVENYTVKYVCAIANGKWVVSMKWIQDSLALNKILPEDSYEVFDANGAPGPRNSRLKGKPSDLLQKFNIFVMSTPDSFPRKLFLDCVSRNGAGLCENLEDLVQKKTKGIPLIIAESPETCHLSVFQNIYEKYQIVSVACEWMFKSICSFQVTSFGSSLLCMLNNTVPEYPPELFIETQTSEF